MQKQKSTNLHDFQHELFLGFIAEQPLSKPQYEMSYIGGQPLWLYEPNQKSLYCQQCQQQPLTFLAQVFCPLDAKHCYNRVFYMMFCEKCRRGFKCLKQQTDENWQPKQIQSKTIKTITPEAFQIESDPIQRKQLLKIINRAKIQVEEQIILEQQGQNDDQEEGEQIEIVEKMTGEQMINKLSELEKAKKNKQYTDKEIQEINKKFQALKVDQKDIKSDQKQMQGPKKDHVFEQYVKVIKTLNNPIMLYSNVAVAYNKTPLNPKHHCKHCNNKLGLQLQLTQKILLFHKSLAVLDWGSIFVYACAGSCQESEEECVVLQYELDAISQEEVAKLKKTKKNRKKNKNKSLSKEKKKLEGDKQQKSKMQPQLVKGLWGSDQNEQQSGDWD